MSKLIPLTQGHSAIVDDEDYEWLMRWKWYAKKGHSGFYAYRTTRVSEHPHGRKTAMAMHRAILNLPSGDPSRLTDHINHNTLDNRRENLRACTPQENCRNTLKRPSKSKYKGTYWHPRKRVWEAAVGCSGKIFHLGQFDSELKAAMAYDTKANELFGEFACLNFPRIAALLAEKKG